MLSFVLSGWYFLSIDMNFFFSLFNAASIIYSSWICSTSKCGIIIKLVLKITIPLSLWKKIFIPSQICILCCWISEIFFQISPGHTPVGRWKCQKNAWHREDVFIFAAKQIISHWGVLWKIVIYDIIFHRLFSSIFLFQLSPFGFLHQIHITFDVHVWEKFWFVVVFSVISFVTRRGAAWWGLSGGLVKFDFSGALPWIAFTVLYHFS